jgi:hypothetical protein
VSRQLGSNALYFHRFAENSHGIAIFLFLAVANTCWFCYSDKGRREQLARRKSGVAMATGRVSLL